MFHGMHGRRGGHCGPRGHRGGGWGAFGGEWSFGGAERGGGGRGRRMFDGGELRLVLLKLIADEPRHGYELIRAIEELTGSPASASVASAPTARRSVARWAICASRSSIGWHGANSRRIRSTMSPR